MASGLLNCSVTGLSRTLPLVFTAGFPFNLWVSSDLRKIQLRTIGGRRRSYDAVRRPLPSSQAQPRARKYSPRRSPRGSRRSPQQELSAAQRARTGRISKWPRDVGIGKSTRDGRIRTLEPVGLHNQAGVCYRRSLMQCLLHVPALYNYFEAVHKECEYSEETCLTCAVKVLFDTYWNDREDTFPRGKRGKVVREFDRAVRYNSGRSAHFRKLGDDNVHNDVHDFLQFLLEVLVEEDPESAQVINDLFQIRTNKSWTCEDCGVITTRPDREDGIILSFEYPGQVRPLEDVIADEMVDTRNVRCESDHCQTERQRAAQLDSSDDDEGVGPERRFVKRIVRGPDVLCIYFRRNDWQGAKIEDEVDYPENLDLSQHTEEGLPLKYRLFGVAAHSGTIDTGHWIGVVRHRNTRHFRTINDSHVSSKPTASFGDARWPQSMGAKFDPTLLVYVKKEGI